MLVVAGLTVPVIAGIVVVAFGGGGAAGSRPDASVKRQPARPALVGDWLPADVVAPRVDRISTGDGRFAGVAYDPGSGVRRVELHVDGRRVDAAAGACRSDCVPALRFLLADGLASEELHAVAVVAEDAAGNRALLWQRLTGPDGARRAGGITAALEHDRGQLAAGSRYAIGGRLVDHAGRPIHGGRVELVALERTAGGEPERAAIVVTDDAGRWRVGDLRASEGSRIYVARHLDDADVVMASSPVRVSVPVDFTVRVRRTPTGRVVAGRVAAPAASSASIRLLLASRQRGGWRSERSGRASSRGRFELRVPARLRGRVAVFVAPSPDLPYAPAGRVVDLARP